MQALVAVAGNVEGYAMQCLLEEAGVDVVVVRTLDGAREALAKGEDLQLLVAELLLPRDLEGLELIREARQARPELPILVWTNRCEREVLPLADAVATVVIQMKIDPVAEWLAHLLNPSRSPSPGLPNWKRPPPPPQPPRRERLLDEGSGDEGG